MLFQFESQFQFEFRFERERDEYKYKAKEETVKKKTSSSSFNNKKEYFEDSLYKELGKLPRPSYPKFHFDILHQHNGDGSEGISNVNNTKSRPSHARLGK